MNTSTRFCGAALCATFLFGATTAHAQSEPQATESEVADPTTILVHVDTAGVVLLRRRGRLPICSAPCDVRVPRGASYVVELDGHKSDSFRLTALASLAGYARVDVALESKSRAKAGGIVLGATLGFAAALAVSGAALDAASKNFSSYCSGWFCISDESAGRIGAVLLYGAAAIVGIGGLVAGLVLLAAPSTTTTVHVSSDDAPTRTEQRAKWTPTFDANAHGASIGIEGSF